MIPDAIICHCLSNIHNVFSQYILPFNLSYYFTLLLKLILNLNILSTERFSSRSSQPLINHVFPPRFSDYVVRGAIDVPLRPCPPSGPWQQITGHRHVRGYDPARTLLALT